MNKVILIGRLTAEPEIRHTNSGKTGEFAEKYLRKGMKIAIEGRIQTGSYEKDSVKHYTTDIIVDRHEFCESKRSADSGGYAEPAQNFTEIDDDGSDLPF